MIRALKIKGRKPHVKIIQFSNSGIELFCHADPSKVVYLRFIVSCGSYNLMDKKVYNGKIKTTIKKLWIE